MNLGYYADMSVALKDCSVYTFQKNHELHEFPRYLGGTITLL